MHLEDLRRVLLEERDSGVLTPVPVDLYLRTNAEMRNLQQEVYAMDDPFSDEARILIEKVASIRETIEEIFRIRSEKIISLAQSQSDGSYIDREEIRTLIPAELEMFNRVVDAIRLSRTSLVEWRTSPGAIPRTTFPSTTPVIPVLSDTSSEGMMAPDGVIGRADDSGDESYPVPETNRDVFPYTLVRVKMEMEPFMGVDGNTYELATGDIVTLPKRNAEVLIERDIVLNINRG